MNIGTKIGAIIAHFAESTAIKILINKLKIAFPEKTIWLYTGYSFEEIKNLDFIQKIDVLVDGVFDESKKDLKLHWVGSSNQRVIDIKKTFDTGSIVLHK